MTPIAPIMIETLEPRWSPARLVAGPLPSEFGANLTAPPEFEAETALEPEVEEQPPVVDPTVPTISDLEPELVESDDETADEDETFQVELPAALVNAGTLVLSRPSLDLQVPSLPINDLPILALAARVSTPSNLFATPIEPAPGLRTELLTDLTPPLGVLGSFSRVGLADLVLSAPTSGSVQLGTKLVQGGVVTAVSIGDISAILHDALRLRTDGSVLALSAEGSTLPVGEEPPVLPVPAVPQGTPEPDEGR
jgi:hypothetical protein